MQITHDLYARAAFLLPASICGFFMFIGGSQLSADHEYRVVVMVIGGLLASLPVLWLPWKSDDDNAIVSIARDGRSVEGGNERSEITPEEIEAAIDSLPGFELVQRDNLTMILIPGVRNVLIQERERWVCEFDNRKRNTKLFDAIQKIATRIPSAVVEHEVEQNTED